MSPGPGRIKLLCFALACAAQLHAADRLQPVPVPAEIRSSAYSITINGKPLDVAHAAASYDYASFDIAGPADIAITAAEKGFWDHGVDIQPWRLGIRPTRQGDTIRFRLTAPAKLSISRPGDFLNHAAMLFLFASRPVDPAPTGPSVHIVTPGVHRESLNPKSGETWYLAPGAVVFGSLNLWQVDNVKVLGRGTIVYDGPQNPEDDDGWMQKPDWHCIGALEAHHIEIRGLTCLVRSRTWSIQMKDSEDFLYDDIRVIGGNPGNANQDGMDWLGGGNTIVRDSFFRASDDVFAMQGNWDGYLRGDLIRPGHDVANILIERSQLSTSISNIVRAGWPSKTFNSSNFTLQDSDILASGIGSCGPPFALFTFWGADGAKGVHTGFTFANLWLDDWYSLVQMEQEEPSISNITFRNIWALDQPPLAGSELIGQVKDVHLDNMRYGAKAASEGAEIGLTVSGGAQQPTFAPADAGVRAGFFVSPPVLEPGSTAEFSADQVTDKHARYTWLFGDGETAQGRRVKHRFRDADGTLLNGSTLGAGRFRVLLHVESSQPAQKPAQDWASQSVVVVSRWNAAVPARPMLPGLRYEIYPGTWVDFPDLSKEIAARSGIAATPSVTPSVTPSLTDTGGFTRFAAAYDGLVEVPADGGYSFDLMARDGARLSIDEQLVTQTGPPFAEVCGSPANAVRFSRGTLGLRAGKHLLHLETLSTTSAGPIRLLWEPPGQPATDIPASAFSYPDEPVVEPAPRPLPVQPDRPPGSYLINKATPETPRLRPAIKAGLRSCAEATKSYMR